MYYTTRHHEIVLEERVEALDKKVFRIWSCFAVLAVAVCLLACYLANTHLSYVVYEEKTKQEAYEVKVGEVSTDVCFVTVSGDCYHAEGCFYLKSKRETTVYEAERAGYRGCSRCEPDDPTLLTLTETRYRDVVYQEEVVKKPRLLLCAIGLALVVPAYYLVAAPAKRKHKEALEELMRFRGEKK